MGITCGNQSFLPTIHLVFLLPSVLVMEQQQTMSDPQATRKFRLKVLIICFFSLLALALVIAIVVHLCRKRPWGRKYYKYRKHYWYKRSTDQLLDLRGVGRQAELEYGHKIHRRSLSKQQDSSNDQSIWKRAKVIQLH